MAKNDDHMLRLKKLDAELLKIDTDIEDKREELKRLSERKKKRAEERAYTEVLIKAGAYSVFESLLSDLGLSLEDVQAADGNTAVLGRLKESLAGQQESGFPVAPEPAEGSMTDADAGAYCGAHAGNLACGVFSGGNEL